MNKSMPRLLVIIIGAISYGLLVLNGVAYAGHPAAGHPPRSLEHVYSVDGGMPVEWSFGNVRVTGSRVPVADLTDEERYMIAGVKTCRYSDTAGLEPWKITLFSITNKFFKTNGYIPEQLTPDLIRTIPGYEEITEDRLDLYRSPITGDWPRLDCAEFSPGNAYITVLTPAEIDHFAAVIPEYGDMWGDNYWREPGSGDYKCIDIVSPIYFIRVYGRTDVLYEAIDFIWHVND